MIANNKQENNWVRSTEECGGLSVSHFYNQSLSEVEFMGFEGPEHTSLG